MTDPSDLINLLSSAASALPTGSVAAEGVACDGLIVVRAASPGRLTGIHLDPSVSGLPLEELAAELTSAVNAALASLPSPAVDLEALGEQLRSLQERTSQQFTAFTSALVSAQAALVRRAGDPR